MSTIIDRALAGKFVLIAEIGVNYYDIATKFDISLMDAAKLMGQKQLTKTRFRAYRRSLLIRGIPLRRNGRISEKVHTGR